MDTKSIAEQHRGSEGGETAITQIDSFTTPGLTYAIDPDRGFCSCPAYQFGDGEPCKHLRSLTLRYQIREVHNSRLNGLFDNTEFHLVELRGDEELRVVSVSYSRSGAYLDRLIAEGMAI